MAINSLIEETLKYLETDENNNPKYRFDIYKSGIANYYKNQLSTLSNGLIKVDTEEEEAIPVSVYTIGDVFNTVSKTYDNVLENIQALPGTLDNIKVSLREFGFTALNKTIDTIKAAVVPIEVLQTVEEVYRVAKPLVDKIVNIAAIRFHFVNAALVAQDVLQYLKRVGASTAKSFLSRLWDIFMNTPIFAIYENDNSVNLAEVYSDLSNRANSAFEDIVRNLDSLGELMEYINGPDRVMYEPKYNELGIAIPEDIVDVYHNPDTREIFIASSNAIYKVGEKYLTTRLYETDYEVRKLYVYNGNLYYITGDRTIVRPYDGSDITIPGDGKLDVVFSNPVLLCDANNFYNGLGESIGITTNNLQCHCYDSEDNIIYFIDYIDNKYSLFELTVNTDDEWSAQLLTSDLDRPYGMSYFDGIIYLVIKNNAGEYYLTKLSAGYRFSSTNYEFKNVANEEKVNNIIWTNGTYATDGLNVFKVSTVSDVKNFTFITTANNSLNCITQKDNNSRNYLVCTGGIGIYVSEIDGSGIYNWNEKYLTLIEGEEVKESLEDFRTPDNMAGCLWYINDYGTNFIAYSQNKIYVVGPELINQIFITAPIPKLDNLLFKERKEFKEWWDHEEEFVPTNIEYSSSTSVGNCIITTIKEINGNVYIALFNPSTEDTTIKCGVYPVEIKKGDFVIDYSNPVFALNKQIKIYSFDYINNSWYYTDGEYLYSPNYNSKYNLNCGEDDRAILIDNNLDIYTAKKLLKKSDGKSYGDLTTLVKYKTTSDKVQTAYTKNTCMFSDGDYVYNIIDNGDDEINYDLFQICYKKGANDFRLIQSNDAAFIVSKNTIKKVPLYSTLASSNYGCGYYTDTTLNKWFNAAPYYLISNVLNERKQTEQKDIFLLRFKENFKVELDKLLRKIPDAFISYTRDRLIEELKKSGITIEGDDGQILNLIIKSVADTTANSFGMYVQQKFMEKIGDDMTYNTFADAVYETCLADVTNNMTDDFYKIFMEFYPPIIKDAIKTPPTGEVSEYLLRYYQTHKAEWAKSMTDLIDIDIVDPEYYEIPLKATEEINIPQTTYRYSYNDNTYVFDYIPNLRSNYPADKIIEGYLREVDGVYNFYNKVIVAVKNSDLNPNTQYYINNDGEYTKVDYSNIKTYYTRELNIDPDLTYYVRSGFGTVEDPYIYYEIYDNTSMDLSGKTKYYTCDTSNYSYSQIDYYQADIDEVYYVKNGEIYTSIIFDFMEPGGTYYKRDYIYNEITETYTYTLVEDNSFINTDESTYYIRLNNTSYVEVTDIDSINHLTYYTYEYEIIDERILVKDEDTPLYYIDGSGNIICYYNPDNETYYAHKGEKFNLTADTTVVSGKTYYEKKGNGIVKYKLSTDSTEDPDKTYYSYSYSMSGDTAVDPDKTYYKKSGDGFTYTLMTDAVLPIDSYYEKQEYKKTTDTSVNSDKDYYIQSFKEATSLTDTQYYELGYVKTTDTVISNEKRYFELIDFTEFNGQPYYLPQANGDYKQVFIRSNVSIDPNKTYYIQSGDSFVEISDLSTIEPSGIYYIRSGSGTEQDPYIYTEVSVKGDSNLYPEVVYFIKVDNNFEMVEDVDEQGGPYYVSDFKHVNLGEGDYLKIDFDDTNAKEYYLSVQNPQLNNISKYYEMDYVKVKKPTSYFGYYVIDLVKVDNPNNVDISDYYEKSDDYVDATDISYVYDSDGIIAGIVNDKNLYKATIPVTDDYEEVQSPSIDDNPVRNNWYEKVFVSMMPGSFISPITSGLYEMEADDIRFEIVENPTGNPREQGWRENVITYFIPYSEDKVYVDLGNLISVESLFPPEDDAWHRVFYTYVEEAKGRLPVEQELAELKEAALGELNKIQYIIYPSWIWQSLITSSVMEYYIPKQGDQYRQIVLESNMYPIHWEELPPDIDHDAFDYALTALLYAVKQRLMTNISILVDQGTVKCYSCVDGSSVIKKMVEKNGNVWYNQLRKAKNDVNKAATKDDVLKAFDMISVFNLSLDMLEELLNKQSALYAKYIDMIIEEQVINDNDTEVVM